MSQQAQCDEAGTCTIAVTAAQLYQEDPSGAVTAVFDEGVPGLDNNTQTVTIPRTAVRSVPDSAPVICTDHCHHHHHHSNAVVLLSLCWHVCLFVLSPPRAPLYPSAIGGDIVRAMRAAQPCLL